MKNLSKIIELLFKYVAPEAVFEGKIHGNSIDEEAFVRLSDAYISEYSETELRNLWHYYYDFMGRVKGLRGINPDEYSHIGDKYGISAFDGLFHYVDRMLLLQNSEVVCQYQRFMDWRMLTFDVNEELLVSAFWAQKRTQDEMQKIGFTWKTVIGHNNTALNRIFERGIAENHFHLLGSSPMFHISWLSLMNNVLNSTSSLKLKQIDANRRNATKRYNAELHERPLTHRIYQAALIRLYFFGKELGFKIKIGDYYIRPEHIWQHCRFTANKGSTEYSALIELLSEMYDFYTEKEIVELANVLLSDYKSGSHNRFFDCKPRPLSIDLELFEPFVDSAVYNKMWQNKTLSNIKSLLRDEIALSEHVFELQNEIELWRNYGVRFSSQEKAYEDYALVGVSGLYHGSNEYNYLFSGERWLLFAYLRKIYTRKINQEDADLFYAYLLIKENLRAELIQSNDYVGFANFQRYERRKRDLIDDRIFKDDDVKYAVRENLLNKNIVSLEIRIQPKDTTSDILHTIMYLDDIIGGDKSKYFYTLHFLKRPDEPVKFDDELCQCRHYKYRRDCLRKTDAIVGLREYFPKYAHRVYGIDAASQEIGCRPEVFGTVFRLLSEHVKSYTDPSSQPMQQNLPQLHITYHAGEDFLDVVDGLRAIDEAVTFLGMNCGDRLGHALALGIDIEEWYRSKNYKIVLTKQDWLDNLAWLNGRLIDLKIDGTAALRSWIVKKFNLTFQEIYLDNIVTDEMNSILRSAGKAYLDRYPHHSYSNFALDFNISNYFEAWKLRGDDPELYKNGFFDWEDDGTLFKKSQIHKGNRHYMELRTIPEVFLLYYSYHYNKRIRIEGEKRLEIDVRPIYIDGIVKLQKAMQKQIASKGISIETNPSSNYQIGTFKDYKRHPIFNFYNKNLTYEPDELYNCAQLNVSVNTDDKGVFSTSLENEFSLLAHAKEFEVDEHEHKKYSRSMIYSWIDDVRKMGLDQCFRELEQRDKRANYE